MIIIRDGTCVTLEEVCDGKMDCQDESDELDCQSIKFYKSYLKTLPPPPLLDSNGKTPMNVSVFVDSILDVDEVHSNIKLQLRMFLEWIDPRLEFQHLKSDHNILSLEQKNDLWLPVMIFANTKKKMKATFTDDASIGNIVKVPGAKFRLTNLQKLTRDRIYKGQDG